MKKKNGYTVLDVLVVVIVFGAIALFTISKVSYALSNDASEVFKLQVNLIEMQAKKYGEDNKDKIGDSGMTITVKTLVTEKYLYADNEDGDIVDPREEKKTLNDKKIKITYDNNKEEVIAEYKD